MIRRTWSLPALAALALTACTAPQQAAPSKPVLVEYPKYLYRGVKVLAGTNNVDWSRTSFGVSGNPPNLSLFDSTAPVGLPAQPDCWVQLQVMVPGAPPPVPGTVASWPAPPAPAVVPNAQPGPWSVTFDDNPAGHWNIAKTQIVVAQVPPISNNAASTAAGAVFQNAQIAAQVTVLNGANLNCQP